MHSLRAWSRPLTLVYGPAGSGKTMLVAQWAASVKEERRVAWLSLEADDSDPARFWMYVIEALRSVVPGIGGASVAMLRAPGVNLVDEALPLLINELADVSDQFVLVLDDYHTIEDERVHEAMASLIGHLPDTLRFVMTSRVEPPLRVGTLRARGQLNEIDAAQLRFSVSEAEAMLNDVHGLGLAPEAVKRLHDRTEGWAAGLYLAVLSMRGRKNGSSFVASLSGSDQRVVDYLAAEVLGEQREAELDFLLRTSVLDRFCAALCDAVTGAQDSRAMLDRIERVNYFLIPLDPSHEWYRYHRLFGELLRHELERRQSGTRDRAPSSGRALVSRCRDGGRGDRASHGGRRARGGIRADRPSLAGVHERGPAGNGRAVDGPAPPWLHHERRPLVSGSGENRANSRGARSGPAVGGPGYAGAVKQPR